MPSRALLAATFLALSSCLGNDKLDSKKVRAQMEEHRLFRITDSQLLTAAQVVGARTVRLLDSTLAAQKATPAALSPADIENIETLAKETFTHIELIRFDSYKSVWELGPKEQEVLSALAYSHKAGQLVSENVQKLPDRTFQYVVGVPAAAQPVNQFGIWHIIISTKAAALQAQKGMKGML